MLREEKNLFAVWRNARRLVVSRYERKPRTLIPLIHIFLGGRYLRSTVFLHWHDDWNLRIRYTIDTRAIFVADRSAQSCRIPSRDHPRRKDSPRALHAELATSALCSRENRNSVLRLHASQAERWLMPRFSYLTYIVARVRHASLHISLVRCPPCVVLRAADIYLAAPG